MNKIYLVAAMIWICQASYAQNSISGKISGEDNKPLIGASIYVPDMNKGTTSDINGHFQLLNLPSGKIKIQFSFIGYGSHIESVDLSTSRTELNIVLAQTAIEGEEIVVSGGYNATQHENTVKIEVLKLDNASQTGTPNFAEVLTKVPGVDMISKGSGVSKPVIRGLSMNDILILNNGVRFENYQYSSHHPLGIDEFGIANVEVIKGPASLLYGSDAIGGVINFIKERPAPIGTVMGDYNLQLFSNSLGMTNNLGIKGASKNLFGGLRIGQKTNADYLQGGGQYVPNSRFNEQSLKANAGFTDKIGTFKIYYDYNQQKLGLVEDEALELISKRGRSNDIFYQDLSTHLISSQNKIYLGSFKLDLNAAYQNTELAHIGEQETYELQMMLATFTYEAKLHLPSKENSDYIVGFQGFNQNNSNINDHETILLPNATTNNYSVFGLVQQTILSKLKLQSGLRYDLKSINSTAVGAASDESYRQALEKSYGSLSGSLGVIYNASEELMIRSNFAAAFRTPNLAELTSNGPHELRYELGAQNLVPENSYETDVSMHYHRDNITMDIAGFYNMINNFIFIAPTGNSSSSGLSIYQYQQANSKLYGGELGVHLHPKILPWMHFETTFSSVTGKKNNGEYLPFIPAHKLRFDLKTELDKVGFMHNCFVSINTETAFMQNNAATDETPTDAYSLLNLSIGGEALIGNQIIMIGLHFSNMTDKKYIDHLSTLKEVNYFNPGRNVALSLSIPFGGKAKP